MNEILKESLYMLEETIYVEDYEYSLQQKLGSLREFIATASDVLEKEEFSFEDKNVQICLTTGPFDVSSIFELDGKLYVLGDRDRIVAPIELTSENVLEIDGLLYAVIELFEKQ